MFYSKDDYVDDVSDIIRKNPNIDTEKISEVRELLRVLRAQGVSRTRYNLIPPFRRQMYVERRQRKTEY